MDTAAGDPLLNAVDEHIQENLEDDVVKEALKSDVDLRQYSRQVEQELTEVENASIQDYIKESQNIASLHDQISACDDILARMEDMLLNFQEDLGSISSEIFTLQQHSIAMNIRLKNRQAIESQLSQFVDDIVVPETMINHIVFTPVTEDAFIKNLQLLDVKINFAKEQAFKDSLAFQDISEVLEKLKFKAIMKIRDYLLQKIYQLRKPMTNYQLTQNSLLKHKLFYKFLMANERQVAKEVRDEYIDTMSKIYCSYFKEYTSRLMKLQFEEVADKTDLLGVDDNYKKSVFGIRTALKNKATIFTLGNRGNVLTTELEAPIIVPHASQKNDIKYSFESLFRSQQYSLLDNTCREYMFVTDFFTVRDASVHELFNSIMGKTLSMLLKHMDTYVQDCYDSIALFLSIHLVYKYQILAHKRAVPVLDKYWETLLELMWPKFENILQRNILSIRNCDPTKLGVIDLRPHYMTRRYAEFSAAIVGLNEGYPCERVNILLAQLQDDLQNFLLKMAAEFSHRREQVIFLINNYDMILSVIMERTKDESKESESFKGLLNGAMQEFVEEILSPHFGGMIAFVKDCDSLIDQGRIDQLKAEEPRVIGIVRSFSSTWKKSISDINKEIMQSFTNFKVGTNILELALMQLMQHYHCFRKILSQQPFQALPIRGELIDIHHIMVEVKKYKPVF
ncbi:Vacuolar protein sorting-associated protein 52 [Chamberlinius hualienensis]